MKAIEELSTALTGKMDAFAAELKKVNDKVDAEIVKVKRPGTETKSEAKRSSARRSSCSSARARKRSAPMK